jgi:hypothetical protein
MNRADKIHSDPGIVAASRCPLCRGLNECRLCTSATYKGPCWCEAVKIPDSLLARIPAEKKHQACICRACVEAASLPDKNTENPK